MLTNSKSCVILNTTKEKKRGKQNENLQKMGTEQKAILAD